MPPMDPAWLAYYQSMSYYNMMQASMTGATPTSTSTSTTTTKVTDSTTTSTNSTTAPSWSFLFFSFSIVFCFFFSTQSNLAINPTTGQPDYSQQWIEYYRSIGQNDIADQITRQMKEVR